LQRIAFFIAFCKAKENKKAMSVKPDPFFGKGNAQIKTIKNEPKAKSLKQ